MKIKASDGKTYEVKTKDPGSYEVWLDRDRVGTFALTDDAIHPRLEGPAHGKTTVEIVREVADEFVDRGGAPMRMA